MKPFLVLLMGLTAAGLAAAGPLDEHKARVHLQAAAAGDVDTLMDGYAEDAWLDWVGGPLDGRYRGRPAIRAVWQAFAAQNDGMPRNLRFGHFEHHSHAQGATLAVTAEYSGKATVRVRHVLVYRDGELATEIWQIAPTLKVDE